jgi:hypothetical protein
MESGDAVLCNDDRWGSTVTAGGGLLITSMPLSIGLGFRRWGHWQLRRTTCPVLWSPPPIYGAAWQGPRSHLLGWVSGCPPIRTRSKGPVGPLGKPVEIKLTNISHTVHCVPNDIDFSSFEFLQNMLSIFLKKLTTDLEWKEIKTCKCFCKKYHAISIIVFLNG